MIKWICRNTSSTITDLRQEYVKRTKKAFNLIETAIVLGIVGIVVGGIWVVSTSVRENMQSNDLVTATLQVQSRVNTIVTKEMLWPAASTQVPAQSMGIFPDNWQNNGVNSAITPLGQTAYIGISPGSTRITVIYYGGAVTRGQCVNFTKTILGAATTNDVTVSWRPSGTTLNKASGSLANIISMCRTHTSGTNYDYVEYSFLWGQ